MLLMEKIEKELYEAGDSTGPDSLTIAGYYTEDCEVVKYDKVLDDLRCGGLL
jgi:hypothetical protein